MTYFRAIKKSNGAVHELLLSESEKIVWETHPITMRKWRFEAVEDTPKEPKTQVPIEAKEFDPKKSKKSIKHA